MLSRIDPKINAPQALCICPSRKLAIQNREVLLRMGKFPGITSELAIQRDPSKPKMLPTTAQVIFGTPGKIIKWMSLKKLATSQIKIIVFDEADRMLILKEYADEYNYSVRIMKALAEENFYCQVFNFSCASLYVFGSAVRGFISSIVQDFFYRDYNQMYVKKQELSLDSVKQYKVYCPDNLSKITAITDTILEFGEFVEQTIIFVSTRDSAVMLCGALVDHGYKVTIIQGVLSQEDRDKIIKDLREGRTHILISTETDLLSRGFDQPNINLVINFDAPVRRDVPTEPDYEYYLRWVGRARKAAVFNFIRDDSDNMIMAKIEEYIKHQIPELKPWDRRKKYITALQSAGLLSTILVDDGHRLCWVWLVRR